MNPCLLGLAIGGLALGCASPAPPAPRSAEAQGPRARTQASSSAAAAASVPQLTSRDAAAQATVARALRYVSGLRELDALGPVKGRVISRDEMVARIERGLDTEIPPAVVSASGEILFALGAVPASFEYRRGLLQVMRSELLGFYERGKVRLSMKVVDQETGEDLEAKQKAAEGATAAE